MAKHPILSADKRETLGKAVKKLRREGLLPANVYGKDLDSLAIQVKTAEFEAVFKEVGETGLVDLQVDGQARPVLVKNLQLKYPLKTPLHVDFYQVNLKEKVKTMVPLEIIGEAKAVEEKLGMLLTPLSEVEVEALPSDLPEKIEVNVENLAALDEQLTVADLPAPQDAVILTDPTQIVAKIAELVVEEPEPEVEEVAEGEEGTMPEDEEKSGEEKEENSEDNKEELDKKEKDQNSE